MAARAAAGQGILTVPRCFSCCCSKPRNCQVRARVNWRCFLICGWCHTTAPTLSQSLCPRWVSGACSRGPGAVEPCSPAAAAQARGSGQHRQAKSAGAGRRVHSRRPPPPAPPPRLPPPDSRAAAHPPAAHAQHTWTRTWSARAAHAQRTRRARAVHMQCTCSAHAMQCTRSSGATCRASERSAASPSGSPSATATWPPPAATQRAEPPSLIRIGSSGAMAEPPHLRGVGRRGIGDLGRASGSHRRLPSGSARLSGL